MKLARIRIDLQNQFNVVSTHIKSILCPLQDMAQLIVERPTLMNQLLPPTEGSGPRSGSPRRLHLVLAAMLHMFYTYLVKAQQPQKEAYSWVSLSALAFWLSRILL